MSRDLRLYSALILAIIVLAGVFELMLNDLTGGQLNGTAAVKREHDEPNIPAYTP